ncbi:hypothetical protein BSKO_08192 [Bryopsis sp. KO-2023]|nr:hypothetical protein BSKO_08192 [Bryopsis sp. KO-2023]
MSEMQSLMVTEKEFSTEHIRRGVHYRRSDQDVEQLAHAADVILETDDTKFPAHSSILGLNSSVFCDMFSTCRAASASKDKGDQNVVHLKEETRDVKKLLHFLYDRHTSKDGVDLSTALRLLSTAHKYGVPSLAEMCLGRVLEFWPLHAEGQLLVHDSVQDGLGCRHGSHRHNSEYQKDDEFDVFTWWRAAKQVDECGGMLNRCKAILAVLVASRAIINLNKCYSETFVEEYEDDGRRVAEPRSDMCLILFSEIPAQCKVLEEKGLSKDDCLEISWMVSWLLRSVKGIDGDGNCCICSEYPTPNSDIRICALCPTKLRPFWW